MNRLLLIALLAIPGCGDAGGEPSGPSDATYSVVMTDSGSAKISVIKAVRRFTGLGLRDAKDMVDSIPSVIQKGLTHDAALAMKRELEDAGARVELKRS